MKKLFAILLLSPLAYAESKIYLSCSVDPNANLMQAVYGQRVWISIDYNDNNFGTTSHNQIKERGDVKSEARELEISPEHYKAKGRIYKLNRTNLIYGENYGSEQAYCKKQTRKDYAKQIHTYLNSFKNKRKI